MPRKPTVAVVDYGLCNLFSVRQACEHVGLHPVITGDPEEVLASAGIILPGVGAFGEAMGTLERSGLAEAIKEAVTRGKPLMGVCLGMQLLLSESEEFGLHRGLDIIPGRVTRFGPRRDGQTVKAPQIGWNRIFPNPTSPTGWTRSPLSGLRDGEFMYFVHSYYVSPESSAVSLSMTEYSETVYSSAIMMDNVFAVQFHPEKSGSRGVGIYDAWARSL